MPKLTIHFVNGDQKTVEAAGSAFDPAFHAFMRLVDDAEEPQTVAWVNTANVLGIFKESD